MPENACTVWPPICVAAAPVDAVTKTLRPVRRAALIASFKANDLPVPALPVMKTLPPSFALSTTDRWSSESADCSLRIRASIRASALAPSDPMAVASFSPNGFFLAAPARMRSATDTLAFFRSGTVFWDCMNLSIGPCGLLTSRRGARGRPWRGNGSRPRRNSSASPSPERAVTRGALASSTRVCANAWAGALRAGTRLCAPATN
mmetsp:Transcript_777/g.2337  ORF Transcript_777/g.2337 Transcript_777/m.2337 type:complete len:205 (+) Transcript_777:1075-1689(+)